MKLFLRGADYIGIGPIFTTSTKIDTARPLGLEFLDYCTKNISISKTAIGGIKLSNIEQIVKYKPDNICIISEITTSD
jgi:thiamine-phosphate pyrophosphorylase